MIVNETKSDWELQLKFIVKRLRKSWIAIVGVIVGIVILGFGILFLLAELTSGGSEKNYTLSFILLTVGLLILAGFLCLKLIVRNVLKEDIRRKRWVDCFRFSEEVFKVTEKKKDGTKSIVQTRYSSVRQCREYREYWVLYPNKKSFFVIKKNGMREGTAEELTDLLKRQLGARYKVCYLKKNKA